MRSVLSLALILTGLLALNGCGRNPFHVTSDNASNGRFHQPQFASLGGCTGANRSPHLSWSGAPKGTESFAITMFDPGAQTGHGGFWHWVAFNLPATLHDLPENASDSPVSWPQGAQQARNDYGADGYGGPCPPVGEEHRYILSVYALDTPALLVPANASPEMAMAEIRKHTLAHAQTTVRAGS